MLNESGRFHEALTILNDRRFSPWEGGEGLTSAQYVFAHRALGIEALISAVPQAALGHFEAARSYPHNLGEGKHLLTLERDLDYLSGLAAQQQGDAALDARYWRTAAAPLEAPCVHSYFQALALNALGEHKAAQRVLAELARFADEKMNEVPKIDYFATSLPNLRLFDDGLKKRNQLDSLLLSALAGHGLGEK